MTGVHPGGGSPMQGARHARRREPPDRKSMPMLADTLRNFLALLTAGLLSPRPVARRVIDARPDLSARLAMVALGATIQALFYTLAGLVSGSGERFGLGGLVVLVAVSMVNYALTVALALHVGRRFGGSGDGESVAAAIAWHAILSAALSPLQVAALSGGTVGPEIGLGGLLLITAYAGLNIWLLAACIAEAHRFPGTGRVAAAVVAAFLLLGVALWLLVGGIRQG